MINITLAILNYITIIFLTSQTRTTRDTVAVVQLKDGGRWGLDQPPSPHVQVSLDGNCKVRLKGAI